MFNALLPILCLVGIVVLGYALYLPSINSYFKFCFCRCTSSGSPEKVIGTSRGAKAMNVGGIC